MLNIP
jgi:hypothetical protein